MADTTSELLNIRQAAAFIGVNPGTIRRWALASTLKGMKVGSRGDWRFTKEDLLKLVKNNHDNRLSKKQESIARLMKINQKNKMQNKQSFSTNNFYIVGIGASAGGLKSFTQLLKAIPSDIGMVFILIQHLDPTKKSSLAETLSRTTPLPFIEVKDGTRIKQNHIYAMPSESFMTITDGTLHLTRRKIRGGIHKPIDSFFQSLAMHHGKDAIGIVLSGTGNDGTEGIQAIKKGGGKTIAQDDSAQYNGMPQSAIDSGGIDFILSPDAIARMLVKISHSITTGTPKSKPEEEPTNDTTLAMLHTKTGMDFRNYKTTTVNRRIQRRMLLNHIETIKEYAELLDSNPTEVEALHKDMLIHVTNFFRNPEQLEELEKSVFPTLFKNRSPKKPIMVWVTGCATGEEAYSLAIVFKEFIGNKVPHIPIQILGTDIAKDAIEEAKKGIYKESIAEHVSPKRLRQFFTKVTGGYEVKKSIRDMCEFAVHDVTQKPPRLNFDLVSCRNVLIYLGESLQQKALFMLSSALKPGGFLLLGKSERLGASVKLFSTVDSKQKVYSKNALTLTTGNLRKTVNTQVGLHTTPANKTVDTKEESAGQLGTIGGLDHQQKIIKLREAVSLTREYADEIINELDVINEELLSTNEELTSSNEELQTTNEELETSQEELQTANEEMTTLNEELQTRNEEVTRALDYADAIIKTVREPLVILDDKLRVISANESFYETFRVTQKQTENMLVYDLGNKQWNIPRLKKLLEKILIKNTTVVDYEVEYDFELIGQKTMLLTARILAQGPKKSPLILLSIEDITNRKELEKQKDLFIGIASHELKTPITTIKGYAQMLEKRLGQRGDGKDTYLIQNINKQTDRLTSLINDLLNVSKIQAGKLVLEKKRFDLSALVEKTVIGFQYVTETHQIIKEGEIKEQVFGDQSRIEQVLANLITNAIKYSPKADKVIVRVGPGKNKAIVGVQDFGFGIEKRDQSRVFERFYRTGVKEEKNVAGFGLGLYISSEIIKSHHGKIWVESTKGKGSTFYFTLPMEKSGTEGEK